MHQQLAAAVVVASADVVEILQMMKEAESKVALEVVEAVKVVEVAVVACTVAVSKR